MEAGHDMNQCVHPPGYGVYEAPADLPDREIIEVVKANFELRKVRLLQARIVINHAAGGSETVHASRRLARRSVREWCEGALDDISNLRASSEETELLQAIDQLVAELTDLFMELGGPTEITERL